MHVTSDYCRSRERLAADANTDVVCSESLVHPSEETVERLQKPLSPSRRTLRLLARRYDDEHKSFKHRA